MAAPSDQEAGRPGRTLEGLIVIAIRLAGAGLGFAAQILAARLIGPEEFGRYSVILVWLLLMGHASTAGSNQVVCRFLSHYGVAGDAARSAGLLRFALVITFLLSSLVAGIAIAIAIIAPFGLDPAYAAIAALGFMAVPLLTLQEYLEAISRGIDRPSLGIGPAYIMRHLALAVGLAGLLVLGAEADALTVMALTMAGLLASVVIQAVLLRAHLKRLLKGVRPVYEIRSWLRSALPVSLVDATDVLFLNADILILGLFVDAELVAFYFAATRLAQMLGYVPYGVSAVTAQRFAALGASRDFAQLQSMIQTAALCSSALAVAGAVILTAASVLLLSLFGPGFETAAHVVPLLCVGVVLTCLFGPGEDVLTMLGEEKACSFAYAVALAANVGLNLLLIPSFGLAGAAIATSTALGLRGLLLARFAYCRLGLILPAGGTAFASIRLKGAPS